MKRESSSRKHFFFFLKEQDSKQRPPPKKSPKTPISEWVYYRKDVIPLQIKLFVKLFWNIQSMTDTMNSRLHYSVRRPLGS